MKISKSIKNKTKEKVEKVVLEDLKNVKEVLDQHNIEFWLDCGTLLGAVRDKRFIPWDCDVDLGTWEKDIVKIVSACVDLQSKNFKIELGRNGIGLKKKTSFVPISILFYRLSNGKAIKEWGPYKVNQSFQRLMNIFFWTLLTPYYGKVSPKRMLGVKNFIRLNLSYVSYLVPHFIKRWAAKIELKRGQRYMSIIPAYHFTNLSTMKFYGMEFRIPSKTEEYLIYRYGRDWRVPKRNWNGAKQDGTIFENDDKSFNKNLWLKS